MNASEYWKNFRLGKELDVAGRFIYNGLQNFHQMETFHYEEEIFEFFYNMSVGLERLLKITVILIEHDDKMDQKEFEKSLITHNHLELLKRITVKHDLPFGTLHKEFLQILGKFYKTHRYGRYDLESMTADGEEKLVLHSFLEKYLKIEIDDKSLFEITKNDGNIKSFIGKLVSKFSTELYSIIEEESRRLNIYTFEIRYGSKASKVFQFKEHTFSNEDVLWKELLIFFMNTKKENGLINFLKEIEPLDFDPALASDYLECFKNDTQKLSVMDEMEYLYEEIEDVGDRLGMLSVIGNTNYFFDEDEDESSLFT